MEASVKMMSINGVEYVRADSVGTPAPVGNRAVVVVDRGWIFAGDVEETAGRIRLTRAVWVFSWSGVGFDGVLRNPKDSKVNIRKLDAPVDLPAEAEIFRVPVGESWGL